MQSVYVFTRFYSRKIFFSGQIGLFGMYVNHELRLSNQFVLKSEVGLDFFSTDNNDLDFKALAPVITLEPRWYYNLYVFKLNWTFAKRVFS